MYYSIDDYLVKPETYLKAMMLSHGVSFSQSALEIAEAVNAKRQNLVYNKPLNSTDSRPQELIIKDSEDGYESVVSCVSPSRDRENVFIDSQNGKLVCRFENVIIQGVDVSFVQEPTYYKSKLSNGMWAKEFVSACGLDELNIIPWNGCAISKKCSFCGANTFLDMQKLNAFTLSDGEDEWEKRKDEYITLLKEAISLAINCDCYKTHMHVILIAGNLKNNRLNHEADIFTNIVREISTLVSSKASEGIVLVCAPPFR